MKAAEYARYSTGNQTENSIEYQLDAIRKYCAENGIAITATYIDRAESGTNTDREDFQRMLAAAKRKEFDAVLIYDISRGSRDVADWFNFRKDMMRLGIKVISATQQLGDITNGSDFLVELLNVGMGQFEVLQSRQKSIAGVAVRAKEGVFLGGTAPLGYDIVNQQYVVNPVEAEAVKTIFRLYKFRTMTDERDENGELLPDSVRLTPFGSFLRSTSLDEIPELFNILKGEMSLIGPRPLLVRYLPYYTEEEHHRHDVRPGLTGLAQVNGRNMINWDQKLAYDVQYVRNITFLGDCGIILKTIKKVFAREDIAVDTDLVEPFLDEERSAMKKE